MRSFKSRYSGSTPQARQQRPSPRWTTFLDNLKRLTMERYVTIRYTYSVHTGIPTSTLTTDGRSIYRTWERLSLPRYTHTHIHTHKCSLVSEYEGIPRPRVSRVGVYNERSLLYPNVRENSRRHVSTPSVINAYPHARRCSSPHAPSPVRPQSRQTNREPCRGSFSCFESVYVFHRL